METDFAGLFVDDTKVIRDERGDILRVVSTAYIRGKGLEDVYVTKVRKGYIKAWHGYRTKTLTYSVISGTIFVGFWDRRESSATCGQYMTMCLGEGQRVTLPPGVFHGFKGLSREDAVVVVVGDEYYKDEEVIRIDPHSSECEWIWGKTYA